MRWKLVALVAAVAVLAGAGVWLYRGLFPSWHDRRPMSQVSASVYQGVGDLLTVTRGPDVVQVLDEDLAWTCGPDLFHGDDLYLTDIIHLHTRPALVPELLRRVTDHVAAHPIDGVNVDVRAWDEGTVRVTYLSSCADGDVQLNDFVASSSDSAAAALLASAGIPSSGLDLWRVPCADGTVMSTESATQVVTAPSPAALRRAPAGAVVVVDTPQMYVYRDAGRSYVVRLAENRTTVQISQPC